MKIFKILSIYLIICLFIVSCNGYNVNSVYIETIDNEILKCNENTWLSFTSIESNISFKCGGIKYKIRESNIFTIKFSLNERKNETSK